MKRAALVAIIGLLVTACSSDGGPAAPEELIPAGAYRLHLGPGSGDPFTTPGWIFGEHQIEFERRGDSIYVTGGDAHPGPARLIQYLDDGWNVHFDRDPPSVGYWAVKFTGRSCLRALAVMVGRDGSPWFLPCEIIRR